jgi:hypothetical protein
MMMSSVVDPSAFDPSCFKTTEDRTQAELFFRGIGDNGILVVDGESYLRDQLVEKLRSLPQKIGQQLEIRLEELLKEGKRKVVRLDDLRLPRRPLTELVYNMKTRGRADMLLISRRNLARLREKGVRDADLITVPEYFDSRFEKQRHRYMDQMPTIDQIPKEEVERMIGRAIKYSRWLRFFDKLIGKGSNQPGFLRGISFVLNLWKKDGYFASRGEVDFVEIITCSPKDEDAVARVRCKLINPLRKEFGWDIRLRLKSRNGFPHPRYLHPRYLQAQQGVFLFEGGFDFVKSGGGFKTCEVRVSNEKLGLLQDVLAYPEVDVVE